MVLKDWPRYSGSKKAVTRAGAALADASANYARRLAARAVANDWRRAHQRPMQTLLVSLRRHVAAVDANAQVFQRSKRMKSIVAKLEDGRVRDLAAMQDLGGCRAVMADVKDVDSVAQRLLNSRHEHELMKNTDYMRSPRSSGYRSRHLVYSYRSRVDHSWDGLRIELQIRTRAQHAWATAVEIMGTFSGQEFKASKGDESVLDFFRLMSDFIGAREGLPTVSGEPYDHASTCAAIELLDSKLHVRERLSAYQVITQFEGRNTDSFQFLLLSLHFEEGEAPELSIETFATEARATARFEALEFDARDSDDDVVLVRAKSLGELRRAYPNYFADSHEFRTYVDEAVSQAQKLA